MIKQKSLGFTLVELLAVIVILAIILAIAIPGITGIISSATKGAFQSDSKMVLKALDYKKLQNDTFDVTSVNETNINDLLGLSADNYASLTVTLVNDKPKVVIVGKNKWAGLTSYGTYTDVRVVSGSDYDVIPPVIALLGTSPVEIDKGSTYTDTGATANDNKDGDITSSIIVAGSVNTNVAGTYTLTYNVSDAMGNAAIPVTRTVNVTKPGNVPVLASGMTPIKWNGSAWIDTTTSDDAWYNYTTTDKQWANARTADGSMWVWIPRYVYRISSNWHVNTTGTIDVQFSKGTDDNWNNASIGSIDTGTGASASNNKWTNQPAFTFGTKELTGIWVAKFELSVSNTSDLCYTSSSAANCNKVTLTPKIVPNTYSWRYIGIGNAFTVTRSMETNSVYGWGTSGTDIDTHLIKNTEWGAVVYLSKSIYGQNTNEIWINPANNYTTGCAGDSVSSAATTGCLRAYDTANGQQTSTTGTIYGVYDMSGGSYEYTSSYVNNGNASLTSNGNSIITADSKYKDVYTVTSDSATNNYTNAANKKGDAIYETSSNYTGTTAWYGDDSYMPAGTSPWMTRSLGYNYTTNAGAFYFGFKDGSTYIYLGFRSVLLVGAGL